MYYVMDSRIVPQVRLADYCTLKPPCAHKKRVPHEYIAYLIQKGELYLAEDGILYHLRPGDFILLDPEKYHEGKQITYCEYYYIHFQHETIHLMMHPMLPSMLKESENVENDKNSENNENNEIDESQMHEQMLQIRCAAMQSDSCDIPKEESHQLMIPKYCHIQDETVWGSLIQQTLQVVSANSDHMEYYKDLSGVQFLAFLIQLSRASLTFALQENKMITARGYKKVLEVQSFLHEAYKEPLTGDYLEEKFDINFDYLNRLFRRNMKKTVFQYLRDIRIAHAKQLLTTTSMRIMEVSECVGFADESYFSKVFKKQTGVSPADYAKTQEIAQHNLL